MVQRFNGLPWRAAADLRDFGCVRVRLPSNRVEALAASFEMLVRCAISLVIAIGVSAALAPSAFASSLQVSPVNIEVLAPGAATTLTLRNSGSAPLNAQIRVFRWTEPDGVEKLEPTADLVASPPSATLAPATDYTVRVVRLTKEPVAVAESYRLLVDELPAAVGQPGVVTMVMRYSIPVFFYATQAAAAKLTWSIEESDGQSYLSATNSGDRHARLSALKLRDGNTTAASLGDGLVGYVLGHSTMRWRLPDASARTRISPELMVNGQADTGPIHAMLAEQSSR
ncbi:MAG TPA: molecular chaperone [Stellaceae bacterium]|jgi:fimbrial chaperone protein